METSCSQYSEFTKNERERQITVWKTSTSDTSKRHYGRTNQFFDIAPIEPQNTPLLELHKLGQGGAKKKLPWEELRRMAPSSTLVVTKKPDITAQRSAVRVNLFRNKIINKMGKEKMLIY
jgi:hypothetical protein